MASGIRTVAFDRPEVGFVSDLRDQWAAIVLADRELGEARVTGWAIREYADRHGRATMGIAALARDTSQNRATVERHIAKLTKRGYLERIEGGGVRGRGGFTALTELRIPGRSPRNLAGTSNGLVPAQVPAFGARSTRTATRDEPEETIEPTRVRARDAGLARRRQDQRADPHTAAHWAEQCRRRLRGEPVDESATEPLSSDTVIEPLEGSAGTGTNGERR